MKTLSRAGLAGVASWGSNGFRRMFMSVMTEFLDVGFTKIKKKVLYDSMCSNGAHVNDLLFFSPTFLEYALLAESDSVSSFYYS